MEQICASVLVQEKEVSKTIAGSGMQETSNVLCCGFASFSREWVGGRDTSRDNEMTVQCDAANDNGRRKWRTQQVVVCIIWHHAAKAKTPSHPATFFCENEETQREPVLCIISNFCPETSEYGKSWLAAAAAAAARPFSSRASRNRTRESPLPHH